MSPDQPPDIDDLVPAAYDELRKLARFLTRSCPGGTRPTSLVHRAWEKLQAGGKPFANRQQFMCVAATAMRQIIIDIARAKQSQRRGGTLVHVSLADLPDVILPLSDPDALIAVHEAMAKLPDSERRLVELRWFAGLSERDTAEALGITRASVVTDWKRVQSKLARLVGTASVGPLVPARIERDGPAEDRS